MNVQEQAAKASGNGLEFLSVAGDSTYKEFVVVIQHCAIEKLLRQDTVAHRDV